MGRVLGHVRILGLEDHSNPCHFQCRSEIKLKSPSSETCLIRCFLNNCASKSQISINVSGTKSIFFRISVAFEGKLNLRKRHYSPMQDVGYTQQAYQECLVQVCFQLWFTGFCFLRNQVSDKDVSQIIRQDASMTSPFHLPLVRHRYHQSPPFQFTNPRRRVKCFGIPSLI